MRFSLHFLHEHASSQNWTSSHRLEVNEAKLDEPELAPLENNATRLFQLVKVDAAPEQKAKNSQHFDQWLYWTAHCFFSFMQKWYKIYLLPGLLFKVELLLLRQYWVMNLKALRQKFGESQKVKHQNCTAWLHIKVFYRTLVVCFTLK